MILNERMKQRKEELNLTYEQVAERVPASHLSVKRWMNGQCVPSCDAIPDICRALECTPNYLYGFAEVANG